MDNELESFAEAIRRASDHRKPIRIRGGGSKDFYGQAPRGDLLDTRGYRGVVEYDPTELVITARGGTPLSEIETVLDANAQILAFEPPHFGTGATLGGCVAAGLAGPRRQAAGAIRDFVLGTTLMNSRGQLLRFGGRVMKNVAGYDVSRLLVGSLGTLGLIVDVSLKVLPKPAAEMTLSIEIDQAGALRKLNHWAGQPLPISASTWHAGLLRVRLSGSGTAVSVGAKRLNREIHAQEMSPHRTSAFWEGIREQTDPFFGDTFTQPLWRLSLPSTAEPVRVAGEQLIEWNGGLRWLRGDADAGTIRATAERAGGHATLFRAADKSAGAFQPLAPGVKKIHLALKAEFDPTGIFNPGRLYADS